MELFIIFLGNILIPIGIIFLVFFVLKSLIRPIAKQLLNLSRTKPQFIQERRLVTAMGFINGIANILLWTVVIIVVLAQFNISIKTLLAGAGIVGVAFGLAFQSVIKNFIASFSLLVSGIFEVGDKITIVGVTGRVKEINLNTIILEDENGATHYVPTSEIKVISNLSKQKDVS